jgi:DNA sulfur modification protein DndE
MFNGIRTSRKNKELVTTLTRRLNLGAENVIARLAFSCSLATDKKMDLQQIQDSQGKEYNSKTLFGEHLDIYVAMICVHYGIYKTHKDIPRYVKMHIDDGLELISEEVEKNSNMTGTEFLISKIDRGLKAFN